jgi:hypothetical protein
MYNFKNEFRLNFLTFYEIKYFLFYPKLIRKQSEAYVKARLQNIYQSTKLKS